MKPPSSQWALKGTSGEFQGNTLSIHGPMMTIGRTSENHIVIDDPNVSRLHAKILVKPDGIHIQDEKSRHGVFINGKKIETGKPHRLKEGDQIQISAHTFAVELGEETEVQETKKPSIKKPGKKWELAEKIRNLKLPNINWNRRTIMYSGLGIFLLLMFLMQISGKSDKKPSPNPTPPPAQVEIQPSSPESPGSPLSDGEIDTLKAQAKAALQFQDYLAATELYEKIIKIQPQDEFIKTQYEYSKNQLKRLIEKHLEFAKREYEKLNYERAIIEWKQVMALTFKADPEVYQQTEEKIRDAEKEMQKRR